MSLRTSQEPCSRPAAGGSSLYRERVRRNWPSFGDEHQPVHARLANLADVFPLCTRRERHGALPETQMTEPAAVLLPTVRDSPFNDCVDAVTAGRREQHGIISAVPHCVRDLSDALRCSRERGSIRLNLDLACRRQWSRAGCQQECRSDRGCECVSGCASGSMSEHRSDVVRGEIDCFEDHAFRRTSCRLCSVTPRANAIRNYLLACRSSAASRLPRPECR
jgi:hypothetical protein